MGIALILTGALFLDDLFPPFPLLKDYWPLLIVLFGLAIVWAEKTLTATVSGAGGIQYKGNPALEQQNSGTGEIKPL